jgi:hypothetical protein
MSTDQTTNLGLPWLMPAQAQKHVTVNESLARLDALVQLGVESRSVSAQPGSPADGGLWICPPGKTGAEWGAYADGALAYYHDGAWEALAPKPGWRALVKDEGALALWTGSSWTTLAPLGGGRTVLINGGLDVWQRGTSFSPADNTYTADRWRAGFDGTGATRTVSRQGFSIGQTDVPGGPRFFLRVAQSVSGSGGTFNVLGQRVEDVRTLAGTRVTLSFWAKADAARTLGLRVRQRFGTGGSADVDATPSPATVSLTTAWRRFAAVADLPSLAGKTLGAVGHHLEAQLLLPVNATFTIDLAQLQLEPGAQATPFEPRALVDELARCERYFEKSYNAEVPPGTSGTADGAETFVSRAGADLRFVRFRAGKRGTPSIFVYNAVSGATGSWRDYSANADRGVTTDMLSEGGFRASISSTVEGNGIWGQWASDAELY